MVAVPNQRRQDDTPDPEGESTARPSWRRYRSLPGGGREATTLDDLTGRIAVLEDGVRALASQLGKQSNGTTPPPPADQLGLFVANLVHHGLGDSEDVARELGQRVDVIQGRLEALYVTQASRLRALELRLARLQMMTRVAFGVVALALAIIALQVG